MRNGADQELLAAWEAFARHHGQRCRFDRGLRWLPPTSGEIEVVACTVVRFQRHALRNGSANLCKVAPRGGREHDQNEQAAGQGRKGR